MCACSNQNTNLQPATGTTKQTTFSDPITGKTYTRTSASNVSVANPVINTGKEVVIDGTKFVKIGGY